LKHFYQWGTPEDLRDWQGWCSAMKGFDGFLERAAAARGRSSLVIPMAGRGQRFVDRGYRDPKPLIDIAGRPMIAQALACLPRADQRVLVAQAAHARDPRLAAAVGSASSTRLIELEAVTEGQACTTEIGLAHVDPSTPVLVPPCDGGYSYDLDSWLALERSSGADLIVWTARGHLPAQWRPQQYGWVFADEERRIRSVAVKRIIDGVPLAQQQTIVGTFWFSSAALLADEIRALRADDERVNNEFYLDSIARRMAAAGKRVLAFAVDKFMPWGTPEEVDTFNYWNEVFRAGRAMARGAP
jgi:NDP-sugar pyrophosphorylase family protein